MDCRLTYYEYDEKLKGCTQVNLTNMLVDGYVDETTDRKFAIGSVKNPIRTFEVNKNRYLTKLIG